MSTTPPEPANIPVFIRYIDKDETTRKPFSFFLAHQIAWPLGWSLPRVGDRIFLPDSPTHMRVTEVTWYPKGMSEGMDTIPGPHVWIVANNVEEGPYVPGDYSGGST